MTKSQEGNIYCLSISLIGSQFLQIVDLLISLICAPQSLQNKSTLT